MFYSDYGNSEVVTKKRLAPLPADCVDLPAQAHKYNLALLEVPPPDYVDDARS